MTLNSKEDYHKFCKKRERHFKGQRELPTNRNFLWNSFRYKTEEDMNNYRNNFDDIFPNSPGAGI